MFRTGNPALQTIANSTQGSGFAAQRLPIGAPIDGARLAATGATMTIQGTAIKTAILAAICSSSAVLMWPMLGKGDFGRFGPIGGAILGLILGLVIPFAPKAAPILAPIYAVCQGVFLAGLSFFIANRYMGGQTGIIFQAVGLTFGILFAMALAFSMGLVRIGGTFARVLMVGMGGLLAYSVAIIVCNGILGMSIPNLYSSASPLGIGFTVICLIMASLFLVLDFQFIEEGATAGAPKYMEWVGAFGLLATLVWLYIEALRLLAKLRSSE